MHSICSEAPDGGGGLFQHCGKMCEVRKPCTPKITYLTLCVSLHHQSVLVGTVLGYLHSDICWVSCAFKMHLARCQDLLDTIHAVSS